MEDCVDQSAQLKSDDCFSEICNYLGDIDPWQFEPLDIINCYESTSLLTYMWFAHLALLKMGINTIAQF